MFEFLFDSPGVIVQGITGRHGSFHTRQMLAAGTRVVAGVTPGKGGGEVEGVPVYNNVSEARAAHAAAVSVVFVPAPFARAALLEAVDAGVKLIVCITEGIPVHDMLEVFAAARARGVVIVGPNCPGLLLPGVIKLGIIPESVGMAGGSALASRSGTLTYEASTALSGAGIGQRYIVGVGGDRLRGVSFVDCLKAFEADPQVKQIVLIGEIGGADEQQAAAYIRDHVKKPVFAYVVGQSAKPDTQLGHAGAILSGRGESAAAKTAALTEAGATTANSLPELVKLCATALPK
ncbi:MAG: succinate--CoA ligase subunit alpha [Candidatus Saccharimonadales bacterium]